MANGSEVNLVAKANDLHMVYDKNSIPCVAQFLRGGRLRKIWRNDALAVYQEARRNRIRLNALIPPAAALPALPAGVQPNPATIPVDIQPPSWWGTVQPPSRWGRLRPRHARGIASTGNSQIPPWLPALRVLSRFRLIGSDLVRKRLQPHKLANVSTG